MKISDIKANPNNPRIIKDDKFKKLVESVKNFPDIADQFRPEARENQKQPKKTR